MRRIALIPFILIAALVLPVSNPGVVHASPSTLAFSSGFEMGNIYTEWVSVTGTPEIDSGVVHTGDYSMKCSGNSVTHVTSIISNPNRVTAYIRIGVAPSSNTTILGHPSIEVGVVLTSDRYIDLYDAGTLKVEGTTQLSLDTWYRISVSAEYNGTNYAYYYINGSEEGNATITSVYLYGSVGFITAPGNDAEVFFDDYASDYGISTADIGDIRTLRASPNAVGDYAQYDQTSGYTLVDEFPANDADFTEDNGSDLAYEAYNIEDASTIGIGGSDTIEGVTIWIRGDRDGGGGTLHQIIVIDNSTGYASSDLPFDGIMWYSWYHNDLPEGGGDWTQDRYNAFQIGSSHVGAQDQRIHCILAMVAFKVPADGVPNISNTPSSIGFGTVSTSSSYWSSGSEPSWPLDDGECHFTVTNNSGAAVDISIECTNFSGGNGWTLSSSPGEDIVVMKVGKSGDALEANMVTITTSGQSFITSLADSASIKWEVKLETGTFTDGVLKEATITLTATLS